ncbi:MAG: metallophosphoesterase family protein [Limisphaerales bacterium]
MSGFPRQESPRDAEVPRKTGAGGWTGVLSLLLSVAAATTIDAADTSSNAPADRRSPQGQPGSQRGQGEVRMPTPAFRTEIPDHPRSLILGRPTRDSVVLSVLLHTGDREGQVAFGKVSDTTLQTTPWQPIAKGQPVLIRIGSLEPDTAYRYEFRSRIPDTGMLEPVAEGSFHTARPAGRPFTFTVQADPHLDFGTAPEVYLRSLGHVLASHADFHVDLGDTFMTDKYLEPQLATPHYLAQRYYFGRVGQSLPVFFVLGNHDGETPGRGGDTSMAVWSNGMRKRYFPNPEPDAFYSGNGVRHPQAGLLQDYYAWEWGDAQFIALDPFWFSPKPRGGGRDGNNWWRTLGETQYRWLQNTLANRKGRFTFVFTHHLVGGGTPEGRGGVEASRFFEWGGQDLDGRDTFAQHRPEWPAPIHTLLAKRGGVVVFHGHDHLYVHGERDGVVYQEVPQPGHPRPSTRSADEYGYRSGTILPGSGILRVGVSPDTVTVQYVKADASGTVADAYTVKAR